jgi:hypothetical protein
VGQQVSFSVAYINREQLRYCDWLPETAEGLQCAYVQRGVEGETPVSKSFGESRNTVYDNRTQFFGESEA